MLLFRDRIATFDGSHVVHDETCRWSWALIAASWAQSHLDEPRISSQGQGLPARPQAQSQPDDRFDRFGPLVRGKFNSETPGELWRSLPERTTPCCRRGTGWTHGFADDDPRPPPPRNYLPPVPPPSSPPTSPTSTGALATTTSLSVYHHHHHHHQRFQRQRTRA